MKMGRRLSRGRWIGYVSIQICSAPRVLPATHFDRNESHVIYGTGHWFYIRILLATVRYRIRRKGSAPSHCLPQNFVQRPRSNDLLHRPRFTRGAFFRKQI